MISGKFSFEGWNLKTWFVKNKTSIKLVISALFGLWAPVTPELKVLSAAGLKLLLDSIDFYSSEVYVE